MTISTRALTDTQKISAPECVFKSFVLAGRWHNHSGRQSVEAFERDVTATIVFQHVCGILGL